MAEIKGLKCGDRIEFGGYTWVVLYINTIFALVLSENILARNGLSSYIDQYYIGRKPNKTLVKHGVLLPLC